MNKESRNKLIQQTSLLGVAANLLIAAMKIVIGMAASSIAIISEGLNNAADAATSLLTLIGTKLSAKHPDEKHPFGYGRIEYMTGLVIAILILYTALTLLKESVLGIFHPAEMSVSIIMLVLIAVSAVIKFLLGTYMIGVGKRTDSTALIAVGEDSRNDSVFSAVTIVVSLIYLFFGISLDAFAGIMFAVVMIKAAYEPLTETVSQLLGRSGEEELARTLYKEIRAVPGILHAADMMLHNYGPDAWSGSVNIEIDHKATVGEVYEYLHALQLRIMHEHKVTMVFGIYAVDHDNPRLREIRRAITAYVREQEHVKSYHALYLDEKNNQLYVDFIADYQLKNWDQVEADFKTYMAELLPGKDIVLTIETEFV